MMLRLCLAAVVLGACATGSLESGPVEIPPNEQPHVPGEPWTHLPPPAPDQPPVPSPPTPDQPQPAPEPPPPAPDQPQPAPEPPLPLPAPVSVTLHQTSSMEPVASAEVLACHVNHDTSMPTQAQSYFRVFPRRDSAQRFAVTSVELGLHKVVANTGAMLGSIKLYRYLGSTDGAKLDVSKLHLVSATPVRYAATATPSLVSYAVAGEFGPREQLVVEVFVEEGERDRAQFVLGSNQGTQTAEGYVRAPGCDLITPTKPSALGRGVPRLLIAVTGQMLE